jgi:hypothetical protein
MPVTTNYNWAKIRADWEDGATTASLARGPGTPSEQTIRNHKKAEGWSRGEPLADSERIVKEYKDETVEVPTGAEDRIAELEAQLQAQKDETAAMGDDYKVGSYSTPEEVIAFYGHDRFADIALEKMNQERSARGFIAVEMDPDDPKLAARIKALAEEMVSRLDKFAGESDLRTVKLALPDARMPSGFRLFACPVEPTINDEKQRPGRGLRIYTERGWKVAMPYRCQRQSCWRLASIGPDGRHANSGFCGPAHEGQDPHVQAARRQVTGVTGTGQMRQVKSVIG